MLIALGVCGGIGAYKAVEVVCGLQKRGHEVVAVMTRSAARFVGPVTFEAITRRPVITSQWRSGMNADIEHVAIADRIDLLLVAPCTANVIGKFAHGIADDFLSSLYLATKSPVLLAPAMNTNMLAHDIYLAYLHQLLVEGNRSRYQNVKEEYKKLIDNKKYFPQSSLAQINLMAVEFDSKMERDKTKNLEKDATVLLSSKSLPKNYRTTEHILDFLFEVAQKEKRFCFVSKHRIRYSYY